jgi:hypothetical protein
MRKWAVAIALAFALMCAAIALAQWWAIHRNVPSCEKRIAAGLHC